MATGLCSSVAESSSSLPNPTPTTKLNIVALESQFGPIPEFNICNGDYDITIYDQTPRNSIVILNERLRDADVAIITTMPMTAATLAPEATPRLKAIMIMAAGTDHLDLDYCKQRGIRVLNSPRANTETVAEHAIAMYFAIRRQIVQTHQRTVKDEWVKHKTLLSSLRDVEERPPLGLKAETVGIVGYGGVGTYISPF
jgi:lactate dehydrogenase-like 2-hydroxyacid dehydrogenase